MPNDNDQPDFESEGTWLRYGQPNETVYAAIEKMAEKNIGSVLVMEQATLVGIFTERDYARNIVLKGRSSPQTPIKKVMSTRFACVNETIPWMRAWHS